MDRSDSRSHAQRVMSFGKKRGPEQTVEQRVNARVKGMDELNNSIDNLMSDSKEGRDFHKGLVNLKQDIDARAHAQRTNARTYSLAGGGYEFTPNKPSHDVSLPNDVRNMKEEDIARSQKLYELNETLAKQGLQASVGMRQVFHDGSFGPRADEQAFYPCLTVKELDK